MRKFLILPAAALIAAGMAAPAHAGTATLWACHGPTGNALGSGTVTLQQIGAGTANLIGGGCDSNGPSDGIRVGFNTSTPSAGSVAAVRATVPGGVSLVGATVQRTFSGFASSGALSPVELQAVTSGATFEAVSGNSVSPPSGTEIAAPANGNYVQVQALCAVAAPATCGSGNAGTNLRAIGLTVNDATAPTGIMSGLSEPARGVQGLLVTSNDAGLGLGRVDMFVDNAPVAGTDIGGAACADIAPSRGGLDLSVATSCPNANSSTLNLDTTTLSNGNHRLKIIVSDATGNQTTIVDRDFLVNNSAFAPGQTSAALQIGGAILPGSVQGAGLTAAPGRCLVPQLSMALSQKPLRRVNGIAVFKKGLRYRFRGKLTCRFNGKRVNAPRGTAIEVINTINGKRVSKSGATVRNSGELTWFNPSNYTSRTLTFRYVPATGDPARVAIRISVVKA